MVQKILANNERLNGKRVDSILVLHQEEVSLIGDFCIRFDKMRYLKQFFGNADVDINFIPSCKPVIYEALLAGNPLLRKLSALAVDDIEFTAYDIVIVASYTEAQLLGDVCSRYAAVIDAGNFNTRFFSLSAILLAPREQLSFVFPVHEALLEDLTIPRPGELYITADERQWAEDWLLEQGFQPGERLCILLDNSSRKDKLVNVEVYFGFLTFLLAEENIRVLIFDENAVGKEKFYTNWLGEALAKRMIFSQGLKLREAMCLLAASPVKLIFGPCTGLMHCASGIYNHYVSAGMAIEDVPLLVTYTGQYLPGEENAQVWWGGAPLIKCLMVKQRGNLKLMVTLQALGEAEKALNDSLPCSAYTEAMLTGFARQAFASQQDAEENIVITI